jgi:hypothetical protein
MRHIYNNPDLDRNSLLGKLRTMERLNYISLNELLYLQHLIRKENENAQRANGCTY